VQRDLGRRAARRADDVAGSAVAEIPSTECASCGSPRGDLESVRLALFDGAELRRCIHCGSRRAERPVDSAAPRVPAPGLGELPRLLGGELIETWGAAGNAPEVEPALAEATEREVRRSLAAGWRFVGAAGASEYLDRIARKAASKLDGAPENCRILLFDDPSVRRLALPSGDLLFSIGAIRSIEDEAELVFVAGHELAHVASGAASRRLVALSLAELTRQRGRRDDRAWLNAAIDLIGLGYGEQNEHAADRVGLRAVLALGYDPESVVRYLGRLGKRVDSGDPRIGEMHLAHPLPVDRLRRLQKTWGAHVRDTGASRVNRDAFRRAVGRSLTEAALEPIRPFADDDGGAEAGRPFSWRDWRLIGTGVAILLLAAVFLLVGLLFGR